MSWRIINKAGKGAKRNEKLASEMERERERRRESESEGEEILVNTLNKEQWGGAAGARCSDVVGDQQHRHTAAHKERER